MAINVCRKRADRLHCYICKQYLPIKDFYDDRSRGTRKSSKCKRCSNKLNTGNNRKEYFKKYQKENGYKIKAHWDANYYIRNRKPCEICGNKKAVKHHDDYNKPLKIRWLCYRCHVGVHREAKRIKILSNGLMKVPFEKGKIYLLREINILKRKMYDDYFRKYGKSKYVKTKFEMLHSLKFKYVEL